MHFLIEFVNHCYIKQIKNIEFWYFFRTFEIVHVKKHQLQLNHQNKSNILQHTISERYQRIQIVNSPQLQIFANLNADFICSLFLMVFIWCVLKLHKALLQGGGRVRMRHVKMQYHEQEMDLAHQRDKAQDIVPLNQA